MNKHYTIRVLNNVTSSAYAIGDFDYRAKYGTVEISDGGVWVKALFGSEDEARRIALEINSRIPAPIMRFTIKSKRYNRF